MKTSTTMRDTGDVSDMSDSPDANSDTDNVGKVPGRGSTVGVGTPPSTPRWVKVIGIIVIVLILAFVVLHLTGNSPFGPGSHTMPSGVIELGVQKT